MVDVNERLRDATKVGAEAEMKALLQEPGCNALSPDKHGVTALMWAAWYGSEACLGLLLAANNALSQDKHRMAALMCAARSDHKGCVRLLLPVSDALAKDKNEATASAWAKNNGHESLARFIDAYALALSELASIGAASCPGDPGVRAGLRV